MEETVLVAQPRNEFGTRAARRIRSTGLIPANIYGQKEENIPVAIDAKQFAKLLAEGHRIVTIQIAERSERSVVKEVQYDAFGSKMIHVDFTRIRLDQKIEMEVPIERIGVPRGVTAGGVLSFNVQDLTVSGLPQNIPEHYRLNIEGLEIGQSIRLKDLATPAECAFLGDPETVIVAVLQRREEVTAGAAETGPSQPEVIGRKKEEESETPPEAKKG